MNRDEMNIRDPEAAILYLNQIPAGIPYDEWFRAAAAFKHEGGSLEDFIAWSATCSEKFDKAICENTWESVGAPGKPPITMGTLKMLAKKYSRPEKINPLPFPEQLEERVQQAVGFIREIFKDGDAFELVTQSWADEKGHRHPQRCKENIHKMPLSDEELTSIMQQAILSTNEGAWITFNPIRQEISGKAAKDEDVIEFRYVLVEADELDREAQLERLAAAHLPIKVVSWSGKKSCHALVRVDAGTDRTLYGERVKALYEYLEKSGFPADPQNKNAARLSRIPGFIRGDDVQYLLSKACGPASWSEFETLYLKKIDRRKETSAINGALGGRPQIPVTDVARNFFEDCRDSGKNATVHFYDGDWWRYIRGSWQATSVADLKMRLMGYLQKQNVDKIGRLGVSTAQDILLNLCSDTLAGLPKAEYVMPCWLSSKDSAKDFMCFQNGILNIREAIASDKVPDLQPLTPDFFSDKQVSYAYDPGAECPMWMNYLATTFDDPEMRRALQMMFGYILSGETRLNIAFFLVGNGGDGKSTAAHVLKHMVGGEKNISTLAFNELGMKFRQYELTRNTLNLCEELSTADFMGNIGEAEKIFKIVTGGGDVSTERKFHEDGSAPVTARCVFCTNAIPAFKDRSEGFWSRIVILPFKHCFRDTAEEKSNLKEDLVKELPGILNWAIQGARLLKSCIRFPLPEASRKERMKCRLDNDHEWMFLLEHVKKYASKQVPQSELFGYFTAWCKNNGFTACSMVKFNKAVLQQFPDIRKGRLHTGFQDLRTWVGIEYSAADIDHQFSEDFPAQENPPQEQQKVKAVHSENAGTSGGIEEIIRQLRTISVPEKESVQPTMF